MPIWDTEFDFGITRIASEFHQDWVLVSPDAGSIVAEYLATQHGTLLVSALERDASSLARSAMPDSRLSDLWNASTDGNDLLPPGHSGGRAWMAEVANLSRQRLRQLQGPGHTESHEAGQSIKNRRNLTEITRLAESLAPHLAASVGRNWRHAEAPIDLHATLVECANIVSPELAFRLLLRILVASFVQVDQEILKEIRRLGQSFDYGEFVLSDIESIAQ